MLFGVKNVCCIMFGGVSCYIGRIVKLICIYLCVHAAVDVLSNWYAYMFMLHYMHCQIDVHLIMCWCYSGCIVKLICLYVHATLYALSNWYALNYVLMLQWIHCQIDIHLIMCVRSYCDYGFNSSAKGFFSSAPRIWVCHSGSLFLYNLHQIIPQVKLRL